MDSRDIEFENIEPMTWYSIVDSEYGNFWLMVTKKTSNLHASIAFTPYWVEDRGVVKKSEWNFGDFGDIKVIRPIRKEGWDLICRKLFKTILKSGTELVSAEIFTT